VGGVFQLLDGLIAWVASNAELAGKFAVKPTPDAEGGFVNLFVVRLIADLAIGDTGNLGLVTHRALLVLNPSIDLLPEFDKTRSGKRNAVNPGYKSLSPAVNKSML
jgi:hypothetical protein